MNKIVIVVENQRIERLKHFLALSSDSGEYAHASIRFYADAVFCCAFARIARAMYKQWLEDMVEHGGSTAVRPEFWSVQKRRKVVYSSDDLAFREPHEDQRWNWQRLYLHTAFDLAYFKGCPGFDVPDHALRYACHMLESYALASGYKVEYRMAYEYWLERTWLERSKLSYSQGHDDSMLKADSRKVIV